MDDKKFVSVYEHMVNGGFEDGFHQYVIPILIHKGNILKRLEEQYPLDNFNNQALEIVPFQANTKMLAELVRKHSKFIIEDPRHALIIFIIAEMKAEKFTKYSKSQRMFRKISNQEVELITMLDSLREEIYDLASTGFNKYLEIKENTSEDYFTSPFAIKDFDENGESKRKLIYKPLLQTFLGMNTEYSGDSILGNDFSNGGWTND